MINGVVVERDSKNHLVRWRWKFWYDRHTLWLDTYTEFQRPSKRHSFKPTAVYNRMSLRDSTMQESDVVLPHDIAVEAIGKFVTEITVKRWSERGQPQ